MSLLDQLRDELAALSPEERSQFLNSVEPAPAPAAPPTALEELRSSVDYAELEIAVSEIPSPHELPVLVAALTKRVYAIEHADENDSPDAPPVPSSPGSSVESPAAPYSPPGSPAPSTPTPASQTGDILTPAAAQTGQGFPPATDAPPAAAVEAAPVVTPEQAAQTIPVPPQSAQ